MRHTAKWVRMLATMLLMCALLAACGNKGPLVHADPAPATSASAASN